MKKTDDLKAEKVKNFQRNYLESEKFFSKFSYFLERENFQNLKVIENFQNLKAIESKKISTKLLKVKNIPKPKSENFQGSLRRLQKSK